MLNAFVEKCKLWGTYTFRKSKEYFSDVSVCMCKDLWLQIWLDFVCLFFKIFSKNCPGGKYSWRPYLFRKCTISLITFPRLDELTQHGQKVCWHSIFPLGSQPQSSISMSGKLHPLMCVTILLMCILYSVFLLPLLKFKLIFSVYLYP